MKKILDAYFAGDFKREGGGRNPKMKKVESSDITDGRTVYIELELLPDFFVATKRDGSRL